MQIKNLKTIHDETIKKAKEEFQKLITVDLPMETGFSYKIKTYPMPKIKQAKEVKREIEQWRTNCSITRDSYKNEIIKEIEDRIKLIGELIPMKEVLKTTSKEAKWVTEIRNAYQSTINSGLSLSESAFWRDSSQAINTITKWISEREKAEAEKKINDEKTAEAEWCKKYLIENADSPLFTKEVIQTLSTEVSIEMCHIIMKKTFEKENEIDGEKCYCQSHDEMRHYHFAETYWNGKEVIVYENSETY